MADLDAFKPLAALEAEYAAVVAQSIPPTQSTDVSSPQNSRGEAESADSDSDSDTSGEFEDYALLPSSPVNSDGDGPFLSDEDTTDVPESEETMSDKGKQQEDAEKETTLKEDKRRTIMQSMQQMQLRPPPWAQAANLTDDKLVAMVQQQLQLGAEANEK